MTFTEKFNAARKVSTPLIAIQTPDPASTIASLKDGESAVVVIWDIVRGMTTFNKKSKEALAAACGPDMEPNTVTNPTEALSVGSRLPEDSLFFFHNVQLYIENASVIQGIWNLRDIYKSNGRTLVMLVSSIKLPSELQDVLVLDEPLPTSTELSKITEECFESYKLSTPDEKTTTACVEAVSGLSTFTSEQAIMMALSEQGVNIPELWERKFTSIEQIQGLSVEREKVTFDDIGGVENAKTFLSGVFNGEEPPNVVVLFDEIEKAVAGSSGGDLSGNSQEMLGATLSNMEDNGWTGIIAIGPPGCAKTMVGKAAANTFNKITIRFDFSGMKGSLVGESGKNLRAAFKVVNAISNKKVLAIATCNSINNLPPELRRRFNFGTFFFDLPSKIERKKIWEIYRKKYNVKASYAQPTDNGWTGAEIKQCCNLSYRLRCSLTDAAAYIVPVSKSASKIIEKLRSEASGNYISAGEPGVYVNEPMEGQSVAFRRKINLDDKNVN